MIYVLIVGHAIEAITMLITEVRDSGGVRKADRNLVSDQMTTHTAGTIFNMELKHKNAGNRVLLNRETPAAVTDGRS